MEWQTFEKFFEIITSGGTNAIIFILILIIAFLFYERKLLVELLTVANDRVIKSKESEIQAVKESSEKQHQMHITFITALNEVKIVLSTLLAAFKD